MLFAIICLDKPGSTELRAATRAVHLDYVRSFGDKVILGGPTQTDDASAMNGSVLILELEDLAAAHAFAEGDPYAQAGLFETTIVRPWKKVFPEA